MVLKLNSYKQINGREVVNDENEKPSLFQTTLRRLKIEHKRTRPYSPWQNGVVERSHKLDNEMFYSRYRFKSEEEMYKAFKRHNINYNNMARKVLNFNTPNEMVTEYFKTA